MWFVAEDSTSFSSTVGNINNIVINASDIDILSGEMNLSEGWEYKDNTFTWKGTPTDNVAFSCGAYADITLDSIV